MRVSVYSLEPLSRCTILVLYFLTVLYWDPKRVCHAFSDPFSQVIFEKDNKLRVVLDYIMHQALEILFEIRPIFWISIIPGNFNASHADG
jgi:hypothetical protein